MWGNTSSGIPTPESRTESRTQSGEGSPTQAGAPLDREAGDRVHVDARSGLRRDRGDQLGRPPGELPDVDPVTLGTPPPREAEELSDEVGHPRRLLGDAQGGLLRARPLGPT